MESAKDFCKALELVVVRNWLREYLWTRIHPEWEKKIQARDAAIRAECADRVVKCFFTTMAESGLSTGNDYAVLVISDKLRDAIMGEEL